jgi:hypothetical protein
LFLFFSRYGAHGISYQYLMAAAAHLLGIHKPNIVIAHLGVLPMLQAVLLLLLTSGRPANVAFLQHAS